MNFKLLVNKRTLQFKCSFVTYCGQSIFPSGMYLFTCFDF